MFVSSRESDDETSDEELDKRPLNFGELRKRAVRNIAKRQAEQEEEVEDDSRDYLRQHRKSLKHKSSPHVQGK